MEEARKSSAATKGIIAEEIACNWLLSKGFSLIERNWRHRHLEVDIIAIKENFIHFVEVRSRNASASEAAGHSHSPLEPALTVDTGKQRRLLCAARSYIYSHNITLEAVMDVISIETGESGYNIRFIPNAFCPEW